MKLSIIIPAYNVQEWIGQCLNSMMPLNNKEIEIIVVNDGSTDNTAEVADTYKGEFDNFSIYHQSNGGLSSARNRGLSKAKGKYVFFCDCDDYIDAKEFSAFLNETLESDVDISIGNGNNLVDDKITGVLKKSDFIKRLKVTDGSVFYLQANAKKEFYITACVRLYKKSFLTKHKLEFILGFIHEDEEFAPKAFCLAEKVIYLDHYFYIRRHRLGSITKNSRHKYYNAKSVPSFQAVLKSLISFKKENKLSPIQVKVVDHSIHKCILEIYRRELYYVKENVVEMKMSHEATEYIDRLIQATKWSWSHHLELIRLRFKIWLSGKTHCGNQSKNSTF